MTETHDDELVLTLLAERARRRLAEAAELVEYVRIRRQPGGTVRDGQPSAPSRTPPAPLHVGALDDADSVYVDLLTYVRRWADELSIATLPLTIRHAWTIDGAPLGFRPTVTPAGAAALVMNLTAWLLIHHDAIGRHAGGPGYFEDVAQLVEDVYARFPMEARPDRPHWRRPCEVCGEFAVTADWKPDAEIRDVTVWCESCSHVLVATDSAGTVQVRGGEASDQRAAARKVARIVRQIAVGTTVPRIEEVPA
jgi:hypothetical protein